MRRPKLDDRIRLWRNSIQLFHTTNRPEYAGPFFAAGFRKYIIEPDLSSQNGDDRCPDIVAYNEDKTRWVCVELTTDSKKSKARVLDEYASLDSRSLSYLCGKDPKSPADVLSSRLSWVDDGDHCQIIVDRILEVRKDEYLQIPELHDALRNSRGINLDRLPEIPFSLVPESMAHYEIRRGIVDIVMQLFNPNSPGLNAKQICQIALERLEPLTSPKKVKVLRDRIERELADLVKTDLKGLLVRDTKGVYYPAPKVKNHPQTREMIGRRLLSWTTSTQGKIDDKY